MRLKGIIFGVGAPNICQDGKKTKCAIILTEEIGFIRVYPIPADVVFPVWGIIEFSCERNPSDSRFESYKIDPRFDIASIIANRDQKREVLDACCLKSGSIDPIDFQNASMSSIALVKQDFGQLSATIAQRIPEIMPDDPECGWLTVKQNHWAKPYIVWRSLQGKEHTSHLVGAEIYEGLRKNPENPFAIFQNMQAINPDYERWLLLGNMRDRRNVWVVVHLHRLKKSIGDSTQPSFSLRNGGSEGWPYSRQEGGNANPADKQLALFITDGMKPTDYRGSILTRH